jgi:predicted nucleic acid-binding protein
LPSRSGRHAFLLIDERAGRRAASVVYRLRVRGSVGTLVLAKRRNLIPQIRPLLEDLQRQGYFLSRVLIDAACREAGE